MVLQRRLSQAIIVLLMLSLIGCVAPASGSPSHTQEVTVSFTPALAKSFVPPPTSTRKPITSFEECVAVGYPIENTYPRQCIIANGQIFQEKSPQGVIFAKVYGKQGQSEEATSILLTIDDGYFITGQANGSQCLVRKTDAVGETEWESALGSELRDELHFRNGHFKCWSARQTPDGGYVVIASGQDEMGIKHNYFLLKFDGEGNRKSVKEFNWKEGMSLQLDKDGNPYWLSMFGLAGELIETSDSGYAMVGSFQADTPDKSIHIYRTDANGNYLWDKNLCRDKNIIDAQDKQIVCSDNHMGNAIQSQDGGFVITGTFDGAWLLKTDVNGNFEWAQFYDRSGYAVTQMIQAPDGGFLVAGGWNGDGQLIKTDSKGNLQWSKTFGGYQYDLFSRITMNKDGEIIAIGSTRSFGEGLEKIWLLGIDPDSFE